MQNDQQTTEFNERISPSAQTTKKAGKLKIFFGYAAGVGKTYAMLKAGKEAKSRGVDTVIGYLEPHERKETMQQAEGLEQVKPEILQYEGLTLREMDLDAVLERNPQLVLVDELAHTNAAADRHAKRYQSVRELLRNGIDVYSTLNVQHLESLREPVASITGIYVAERIPDDVFDMAEQVELVDIEPEELLERLMEGKVYRKEQVDLARQNFFTLDNLRSLREISLRRCADRVSHLQPASKVKDHILVCLSSSPSNPAIIRAAARMAQAFHARFTALYIQSPDADDLEKADTDRLQENMRLASRLGADVQTAFGENIAEQIGEYARTVNATKIVIGRAGIKSAFLHPASLTEKISEAVPEAEIFIIPDLENTQNRTKKQTVLKFPEKPGKTVLTVLGPCLGAFALCSVLENLGFSEPNLFAVYVCAILLGALLGTGPAAAGAGTILSLLSFRYLFAVPKYSLQMIDQGYLLSFLLLFIMAEAVALLSSRSRQRRYFATKAAARNALLYETSQNLMQAENDSEIMALSVRQLSQLTGKDVIFYPNENGTLGKPVCREHPEKFASSKERAVAMWVLRNNKRAGASTDTLSAASGLYLAVRHRNRVYGVCGLNLENGSLSPEDNALILSLLGQAGLALENNRNARISKENALASQKEKIRSGMLRSISHDLRTPLTAISGSAQMIQNGSCSEAQKQKLAQSIREDADWLKGTVENLLALTRLEDGTLRLNRTLIDLEEAAEEALKHVHPKEQGSRIHLIRPEEPVFVMADGKLMVQLLINLVDNALKYTPEDTGIEIVIRRDQEQMAVIDVADHGPGISEDEKKHLFDPFTTTHLELSDANRSLGLGLSLCRNIMEVHQGSIEVLDNNPGARFRIRMKMEKLDSEVPETGV